MCRETVLAALVVALMQLACTGERGAFDAGSRVPEIGAPGDASSPPIGRDAAPRPDLGSAGDVPSAVDAAGPPDVRAGGDATVRVDGPPDVPEDGAADVSADTVAAPTVTVVSLNLRCLVDDWEARRPLLVDALVAVGADLVGFQEACRDSQSDADNLADLLVDLEARTGDPWTARFEATHRGWDRYDEGIAVATRLDLLASEAVQLPAGTFPRRVILARVATPAGEIVFADTHLDHLDGAVRATQAAAVVTAIEDFAAAGDAVVLTGDMNEGPGGGVGPVYDAAGLVDAWASLRPDEPGYTVPASAPNERIDYVRVRPGAAGWAPRWIDRILDVPTDGTYASDHLGVVARVAP